MSLWGALWNSVQFGYNAGLNGKIYGVYIYTHTHIYIYIYLCLNDLVRTLSYFSSGVNYISCGSNIAVFCAFKNVNQGTKTTY